MKLRITSSLPGLIEGRIIEVENPGAEVLAWIRSGAAVPVKDAGVERADDPVVVEPGRSEVATVYGGRSRKRRRRCSTPLA